MTSFQKWLIVVAIYIAAIGILLGAFRDRYKFASFEEGRWKGGRFDTWTGRVSVKNYDQKNIPWEEINPGLVKNVR